MIETYISRNVAKLRNVFPKYCSFLLNFVMLNKYNRIDHLANKKGTDRWKEILIKTPVSNSDLCIHFEISSVSCILLVKTSSINHQIALMASIVKPIVIQCSTKSTNRMNYLVNQFLEIQQADHLFISVQSDIFTGTVRFSFLKGVKKYIL